MVDCSQKPNRPYHGLDEERISALAFRYRSGDRAALGELYAGLEAPIRSFVRHQLAAAPWLPIGMEKEDLFQQAYVELAAVALDWRPQLRDNFMPYFLKCFSWRLHNYLRSQSSTRWAAQVKVQSLPHDVLMASIADRAGSDGREWVNDLVCEELLRGLPVICRRVVMLHVLFNYSFTEIAGALGLSRTTTHETYTRAMGTLRTAAA